MWITEKRTRYVQTNQKGTSTLSKIMKYVDTNEYELERFESEKRTEEKERDYKIIIKYWQYEERIPDELKKLTPEQYDVCVKKEQSPHFLVSM